MSIISRKVIQTVRVHCALCAPIYINIYYMRAPCQDMRIDLSKHYAQKWVRMHILYSQLLHATLSLYLYLDRWSDFIGSRSGGHRPDSAAGGGGRRSQAGVRISVVIEGGETTLDNCKSNLCDASLKCALATPTCLLNKDLSFCGVG